MKTCFFLPTPTYFFSKFHKNEKSLQPYPYTPVPWSLRPPPPLPPPSVPNMEVTGRKYIWRGTRANKNGFKLHFQAFPLVKPIRFNSNSQQHRVLHPCNQPPTQHPAQHPGVLHILHIYSIRCICILWYNKPLGFKILAPAPPLIRRRIRWCGKKINQIAGTYTIRDLMARNIRP